MRFIYEHKDLMLRVFGSWKRRSGEIAYVKLGLDVRAEIEFPSDWHEHRRAWVRFGLGFIKICFSFPWKWVTPDHGQCSGPRYGFAFFGDAMWLYFGKDTGRGSDPRRYIAWYLPWSWAHVRHDYLDQDGFLAKRAGPNDYSAPDTTKRSFPYRYTRRSGEVQRRIATINGEEREWRWRWFTWSKWPRKVSRTIHVDFNDEVGEGTGSWKGGTLGCSYDWKRRESQEQALRRMERERKFCR
jgi:hypothetical protein